MGSFTDFLTGGGASAAGGIISSALNLAFPNAGIKRRWKYEQKAMDKQAEINEAAAQAAFQRESEFNERMYEKDYALHTQSAMRKQLEDAGLSVGLMYGMGGAGGAGGGSTSANSASGGIGGVQGPQGSPLGLDPMLGANIRLAESQAKLNEAKANEAEKNAGKTEAETETENKLRDSLVASKYYEALKTFIETAKEKWAAKYDESDDENNKWIAATEYFAPLLKETFEIGNKSVSAKDIVGGMLKQYADARQSNATADEKKAIEALTNEKAEGYATELMAMIMVGQAQSKQAEAMAKRVAYETGEEWNWKTVLDEGIKIGEAIGGIYGKTLVGKAIANRPAPVTHNHYGK